MTAFDPPAPIVTSLVNAALAEDLGLLGDITSNACVDDDRHGVASFVTRDAGVLAGTALATEVYRQADPEVAVSWLFTDGDTVEAGAELGRVTGRLRSILAGERVALNFLSHCSGVASMTRRYVDAARGEVCIRDTRKTLPGLRAAQKAAVRAGGGFNHRESLSDAVLIKDNHLSALGIATAVKRSRTRWPGRIVEVECDDLEQVAEARDAGVDIVLVDNMTPADVAEAVALCKGLVQVEVSGNVTLETVPAYSAAGVDFISVGAITHSVRVLDIGLDVS